MSLTKTLPNSVTSSKADCRFCDLAEHELPISNNEYGVAVPSIGSLMPGWTLVFPTTHVYSLAELDEEDWKGFSSLLASVQSHLENEFGHTILFEHGSAGMGRTAACGVDHAHMHVVPIDIDIRAAISEVGEQVGVFEWQNIDERVQNLEGQDYIYVVDNSGSWVTYANNLPSQVVRRALAHYLGLTGWDWKTNPRLSVMKETRQRFGGI